MGIKGIYKEIGAGQRVSMTKLAIEHLEQTGRPLRVAIDISIWQFQVQAARGGSNPAIRTLFYRLLRLLSLSIQPIFVFDGPNKPVFKRNKRSGRGDGVATSMAKRMIRLFGFQSHDAPGEAEAECALLQRSGIVDAVLSEDVDTIMFGCTKTLRNWSSEGAKGSKSPTHISVYDTEELRQGETGLDREGMVLVALMSGGDYLPEGIPGAGVKLACEAARGGFGKSLCQLKRSDAAGLEEWRSLLTHELRTNESGFFRTRHKALNVPVDFPNLDVLRYYTHPVVSPPATLDRLKEMTWGKPVDILGLREFVRETFDWNYRGGAYKFIRVLAPGLLIRGIMDLSAQRNNQTDDLTALEQEESRLVKSISTRRSHFSTDATPELRMSFIPTEIVGHNFQDEPEEVISFGRDGLALNSDDEVEALGEEDAEAVAKTGSRKPFNPTEPDLCWVPETVAKLGIPLMVEDWEAAQRAKLNRQKTKTTRQKSKAGGMAAGALDKYVKVTKNLAIAQEKPLLPLPLSQVAATQAMSPVRPRSPMSKMPAPIQSSPPTADPASKVQGPKPSKQTKSKTKPRSNAAPAATSGSNVNPWTIAGSQSSPRVTKSSYPPKAILISSSPPTSPTSHISPWVSGEQTPQLLNKHTLPEPVEICSSPAPGFDVPTGIEDGSRAAQSGAISSSPSPSGRPLRKLVRTESVPVTMTLGEKSEAVNPQRTFTRSHTVAADPVSFESDDDMDLPPLSNLGTIPTSATSKSQPDRRKSVTKAAPMQQGKLDAFGLKTTKVYIPRKSEPGFFKEIDMSIEEAETVKGQSGSSRGEWQSWRRSDVSVVDLRSDT